MSKWKACNNITYLVVSLTYLDKWCMGTLLINDVSFWLPFFYYRRTLHLQEFLKVSLLQRNIFPSLGNQSQYLRSFYIFTKTNHNFLFIRRFQAGLSSSTSKSWWFSDFVDKNRTCLLVYINVTKQMKAPQ